MNKNEIEAILSEEDLVAVDNALALLETKMPFLVALSASDMKRMVKLGRQSEAFALRSVEVGALHSDLLPRGLDLGAAERDKALREQLLPRAERLRTLLTKMDSTVDVLGSQLLRTSLVIYKSLKQYGKSAGIDSLVVSLGTRFARKRKQSELVEVPE